jgi:hypothetical protein
MSRAAETAHPARLRLLLWLGAACYFALFAFYPALLLFAGVSHYGVWFLDSFAILASNDAVTRGLDPYVPNPLDYFGRPHVYSHWWLYLRDLGLTRAQNLWVGLSLVLTYFLTAVWRLRPREPRELLLHLAVFCSPGVLLAFNRANNDLAIFILLAPVVPLLVVRRPAESVLAAVLIAFAAGLKYYPAAAVVVVLAGGRNRREAQRLIALALALLLFVAMDVAGDLKHFDPSIAKAKGLMSFSGSTTFEAIGLDANWAMLGAGLTGAAVFAWAWWRRPLADWRVVPEREIDWLHFLLGAAVLTGCFLTGTNFAYRWVFVVWLLPALWWLPRDPDAPARVRGVARVAQVCLLFALWTDAIVGTILLSVVKYANPETLIRIAGTTFQCEQLMVWGFFACLLVFLAHFGRQAWVTVFGPVVRAAA